MHQCVTFNFGSAKVCSPAIFETCFSYYKDIWFAATYCIQLLGYFGLAFATPLPPLLHIEKFSMLTLSEVNYTS